MFRNRSCRIGSRVQAVPRWNHIEDPMFSSTFFDKCRLKVLLYVEKYEVLSIYVEFRWLQRAPLCKKNSPRSPDLPITSTPSPLPTNGHASHCLGRAPTITRFLIKSQLSSTTEAGVGHTPMINRPTATCLSRCMLREWRSTGYLAGGQCDADKSMHANGYVSGITRAVSGLKVRFTGFLFVDDTDLIAIAENRLDSAAAVVDRSQASVCH